MIVVKVGGSLYQSDRLAACLKKLASLAEQEAIVIVPGGGPFADQVRQAQNSFKFSDSVAHHMAILAMAQFGLILASLLPDSLTFSCTKDISINQASLSIWLPDEQLLHEQHLTHSWNVTSDRLALWLAYQLKAKQLILIKHASLSSATSLSQLSQQHVIDHAFPDLYQHIPVPTSVIGIEDILHSESILTIESVPL